MSKEAYLQATYEHVAQQQAALAQILIHAARTYCDDARALEYVASFAFSLARWLDDTSVVLWDDIHAVCEQRYVSLQSGQVIRFDERTLRRCESHTTQAMKHASFTTQSSSQYTDTQKNYRAFLRRDIAAAREHYQGDAQMCAYLAQLTRIIFGEE